MSEIYLFTYFFFTISGNVYFVYFVNWSFASIFRTIILTSVPKFVRIGKFNVCKIFCIILRERANLEASSEPCQTFVQFMYS